MYRGQIVGEPLIQGIFRSHCSFHSVLIFKLVDCLIDQNVFVCEALFMQSSACIVQRFAPTKHSKFKTRLHIIDMR